MTGTRTTAIAMLTTAALLMTGTPAQAATYDVTDPTGDGEYLDIIDVHVNNREKAVVTRVGFDRVRRGDLIVAIDVRHKHKGGYRVISEYRGADKEPRSYVLMWNWPARGEGRVRCARLSVMWDKEVDTTRLRVPDKCLGGDHGDVSLSILTERGADDDWAPEDADGNVKYTPWIAIG